MPNRDYYLKTEDTYVEFRKKYVDYLAKLLTLAGEANGTARAAKILELETKLATDQWTQVQNRDPVKTYNKNSLESVAKLAPGLRLERLVRRQRPAARRLHHPPAELRDGARQARERYRPRGVEGLPHRAHDRRLRARCCRRIRRGLIRLQFAHAARHRDAAPALEARRAGNRQRDGRGARRCLRRAPLPAGSQGAHGDARRQPARGVRPRHRRARLDERADARPRRTTKLAKINVKIGYPDKWRDYSGARDPPRRPRRQRDARDRVRVRPGRPRARASRWTRPSGS